MSQFRLLLTAGAVRHTGPEELARLQAAGITIVDCPVPSPVSAADMRRLLPGIDAVWAASDYYSAEALAGADRLKLIVRWGVGIDTIDLDAATRAGVIIANTPGMTTDSVADYAFGLMLDLARHLTEAHTLLRAGHWRGIWGVDVWRKTLGIIGLGHIGQGMARRAQGFAMRVLAYDPYVSAEAARAVNAELVPLPTLLKQADFVSLHANLTPETRGLLGAAELRQMRPDAYLINCGRGALVETSALVRALQEGWIAGAAVDVYDEEPVPPDHPLLALPNCLTLPHCASSSLECARLINRACADAILAVHRGEVPRFVCNPEVLRR